MATTTRGLVSQIFIHANENVVTTLFYWQMTSGENPFGGPPNLGLAIQLSLAANALPAFGTNTRIEGIKCWAEGYANSYSWMQSTYLVGDGAGEALSDLRHVRLSLISELDGEDRIVNRNQISGADSAAITDGRLGNDITDSLSDFILAAAGDGLVSGGITFKLACRRDLTLMEPPGVGVEYRGLESWQFNPFVGTRKDRVKRPMGKRKPEIVLP